MKGIIMSGNHPKLILDGVKTQTRRVVKSEWKKLIHDWDNAFVTNETYKLHVPVRHPEEPDFSDHRITRIYCPYGEVGDRLWVRETFTSFKQMWVEDHYEPDGTTIYKADFQNPDIYKGDWKPSIHMFRRDSRITLEITEVRVERVQEITEEDALAEGIIRSARTLRYLPGNCDYATWAYSILWDSLNAKRGYGWKVNPWVWVTSFRRIE
jgi:hypothetical protein